MLDGCVAEVRRRLLVLPAIERRIKLYSQRGSLSANLVKIFTSTLPCDSIANAVCCASAPVIGLTL